MSGDREVDGQPAAIMLGLTMSGHAAQLAAPIMVAGIIPSFVERHADRLADRLFATDVLSDDFPSMRPVTERRSRPTPNLAARPPLPVPPEPLSKRRKRRLRGRGQ